MTAFKPTPIGATPRRVGGFTIYGHTAACLWLAGGSVVTVQAWMVHASVPTTDLYLHHLGTSADGPDWIV